ncbi:hypothetical protein [Aquimonas sp.]|jgi:hypothetical protein|uniref:hypothetical protein n=1 Tax=Aquimonas sp. TaxID=1872588 RepID=UPI0037C09DB1
MFSLEAAQLLSQFVGHQIEVFPRGWGHAAIYVEVRRESDGYLANSLSKVAWVEGEKILDIDPSLASVEVLQQLIERREQEGPPWSALRIAVEPDGRFKTKLYYDSWPDIDGDWRAASARLDSPDAP